MLGLLVKWNFTFKVTPLHVGNILVLTVPIFEENNRSPEDPAASLGFKTGSRLFCFSIIFPNLPVETIQDPTRVDVSDHEHYLRCGNKVVGGIQVDLTIIKGQDSVASCPNIQGGGNLEAEKDGCYHQNFNYGYI